MVPPTRPASPPLPPPARRGQNAPPLVVITSLQSSPPPPWYVQPPATGVPAWAGVVGYKVLPQTAMLVNTSHAQYDRLNWDATFKRLFVSAGEDGLFYMSPNANGAPMASTAQLVPGSNDCNGITFVPSTANTPMRGFTGDVAEFTANTGDLGVGIIVYNFDAAGAPPRPPGARARAAHPASLAAGCRRAGCGRC